MQYELQIASDKYLFVSQQDNDTAFFVCVFAFFQQKLFFIFIFFIFFSETTFRNYRKTLNI